MTSTYEKRDFASVLEQANKSPKTFFQALGETITHPISSMIHPINTTFNLVEPLVTTAADYYAQNRAIAEVASPSKSNSYPSQQQSDFIPQEKDIKAFSHQPYQQQQHLQQLNQHKQQQSGLFQQRMKPTTTHERDSTTEYQFKRFDNAAEPTHAFKRDKLYFEQRKSIALNLAKQHREQIERLRKEQEIHEKLLLEAEALSKESFQLAETARAMEILRKEDRDRHMAKELILEAERAAEHDRAVQKENERAEAEAEVLLHEKEYNAAQELLKKHTLMIEHSIALVKKHEIELEEAALMQRRVLFEEENIAALQIESGPVPRPESMELEVDVKSNILPEQRLKSSVQAKDIYKKSVIKEEFQMPPNTSRPETMEYRESMKVGSEHESSVGKMHGKQLEELSNQFTSEFGKQSIKHKHNIKP